MSTTVSPLGKRLLQATSSIVGGNDASLIGSGSHYPLIIVVDKESQPQIDSRTPLRTVSARK